MDRPVSPGSSLAGRRRATLSLSDLRTPLVENILSMLPSGDDKAFKYALYNVLALILAAVCITTLWAAYCILEPFIVPLLWALLCGSVIHPFKDRLVTFAKEWLVVVKTGSTPLSFQLAIIPFRAIDSISEGIGTRVSKWWKYLIMGSGGFFLTYLIYHNPPITLGLLLYWTVAFLVTTILWMLSWINTQFVVAVTVIYIGTVLKCMSDRLTAEEEPTPPGQPSRRQDETDIGSGEGPRPNSMANKPEDRLLIRGFSVATWFIWISYICSVLPYPLLIVVILSALTGTFVYVRRKPISSFTTVALITLVGGRLSRQSSRGVSRKSSLQQMPRTRRSTQMTPSPGFGPLQGLQHKESPMDTIDKACGSETPKIKPPTDLKFGPVGVSSLHPSAPVFGSDDSLEVPSSLVNTPQLGGGEGTTNAGDDEVDGVLDSNKFLYGVLCACIIVQVWNRLWLVQLLPIPLVYYGGKRLCIYFGFKTYLETNIRRPFMEFYSAKSGPSRDLFPQPVRILFRITYEADRKFVAMFESYLDMVATIVILVAVVVFSVIFLIFVATQFYAEGDHLVRVGANVINSTVNEYPEISQMLPEGWESLTGSLIGNAYHYGRDYIKTLIRDSVAERNPAKAEEMERQVIELWDRIYLSWNRTWGSFEPDSSDKTLEWDDIVKTGQNVTTWFDTSMLVAYAKSNYGQLRAVLESIYTVLVGNVSLALSAITSVFSVLFGGGSALLNLIISFVVFFTALFYLLSASSSTYKPVQLFNTLFPGDGKHSSYFVSAIEESVSGVFSATLKMSAFYGMWTWLIHTLFQVNIVFVPSFFAAIFAAVPLLMPYWAAFPAILELWLIQGQWTRALLMLVAQMLPMSVVDAQIYSEIKGGGHPYLTALAVAGGIFYFGFQGAIMGPVVLCVLFVAVKVSSTYMKEGTQLEFQ